MTYPAWLERALGRAPADPGVTPGPPSEASPAPSPGVVRYVEDAATLRHLDCARYAGCLDVAEHEGWPGFNCAGCSAYHPRSGAELADDHPGLLLLAHAVEHDGLSWRRSGADDDQADEVAP